MPPKAKGKRERDAVKPISGLDVDALLGEERKSIIRPENAVPDFKNMIGIVQSDEEIADAAKQIGTIIQTLITESFGDSKYAQAMECFGVLREELINIEEPKLFNTFVQDLKKSLLNGALGGDRRDFWFKIRYSRMGLIDETQSDSSAVTVEEAEEVSSLDKLNMGFSFANQDHSFTDQGRSNVKHLVTPLCCVKRIRVYLQSKEKPPIVTGIFMVVATGHEICQTNKQVLTE